MFIFSLRGSSTQRRHWGRQPTWLRVDNSTSIRIWDEFGWLVGRSTNRILFVLEKHFREVEKIVSSVPVVTTPKNICNTYLTKDEKMMKERILKDLFCTVSGCFLNVPYIADFQTSLFKSFNPNWPNFTQTKRTCKHF